MKNMGTVHGSEAQAKPLIIGKDTVYVHTNIQKITMDDGFECYQYNEVQYDKDEYIEMLNNQVTDTQLALCEIYELL